jgi:uncharacterized membrane protein
MAFSYLFAQQARPDLLSSTVSGITDSLSLIVGLAGVGIILWGAYGTLVRLIATETALGRGIQPKTESQPTRPAFTSYVLMGLEFLIAATLIRLVSAPDWQHLAMLGGIVLTRLVLSLNVRWESGKDSNPLKEVTAALGRAVAPLEIRNGVNEPADRAALAPVHAAD